MRNSNAVRRTVGVNVIRSGAVFIKEVEILFKLLLMLVIKICGHVFFACEPIDSFTVNILFLNQSLL